MGKKDSIYYRIIGIVIIAIILIPIVLNYVLQIQLDAKIVGFDTDWLSFWGGYLGGIVSSAIAFIILYIQRKENRQENKKNRLLQLKVLSYQRECQWFDNLRKALADSVNVYHANHLIEITNLIKTDNFSVIQQKIKEILDNLISTETKVGLLIHASEQNNNLSRYSNIREELYNNYCSIINDIQLISKYYCQKTRIDQIYCDQDYQRCASDQLKALIKSSDAKETFSYNQAFDISIQLTQPISDIFIKMRKAACDFIVEEKNRIDSILDNNDESE